jgi:hypothetical protein
MVLFWVVTKAHGFVTKVSFGGELSGFQHLIHHGSDQPELVLLELREDFLEVV